MSLAGTFGNTLKLSGLTDVSVSEGSAINGQFLCWNNASSKWNATVGGAGSTTLASLTDVSISAGAAINGFFLVYNNASSKWNATATPSGAGGATTLAGLSDVSVSGGAAIAGFSLAWDNAQSKWAASNVAGSGGNYSASFTGAISRTVINKLSEEISVKDFGAVGDGSNDDTSAIQVAITYCIGSQTVGTLKAKSLYFPEGTYKISSALKIGTGNTATVTGLRIRGACRFGTTIVQASNNVAIFKISPNLIHSCVFEHMALHHSAMQTVAAGATFFVSGSTGTDLYNSVWSNINADNFDVFFNAPSCLVWGLAFRDCWLGDGNTGITNIQGAAGEPRNIFQNIYIGAQSMAGPLFNHNACYCKFDNVEVNSSHNNASMMFDQGGGVYIIDHFALEDATFNGGGTTRLFDILNGGLEARFVYTTALSISAGSTVYLTRNNSNPGFRTKIDQPYVAFSTNNGAYYLADTFTGNNAVEFSNLVAVPFGSACAVTDMVGSQACDAVIVTDWNNESRAQFNPNADVTLSAGSPTTQVYDLPLTVNRSLNLPEDRQQSNNQLFTGRRFRISRTHRSTGAFSLTIKNAAGSAVATIAGSTAAYVEVMWARTNNVTNTFSWTVLDQHTF